MVFFLIPIIGGLIATALGAHIGGAYQAQKASEQAEAERKLAAEIEANRIAQQQAMERAEAEAIFGIPKLYFIGIVVAIVITFIIILK
jgi:hypothetical protein